MVLARPRRPRPAAQPPAPAPGRRVLRQALHGLQRLLARALDAADRPVHAPDGLHDHRRQHPGPGLPDLGDDAARARLPARAGCGKWHLTHGDNHWTALTGEQALERYGFAGGVYPSPDGAPGQGWRVDPHIAARFSDWFAARGRRRAVVHDRLVRQPARHRLVVQVERPRSRRGQRRARRAAAAAQLRDAGAAARAPQAAPAALLPGHRRRVVRAGALQRPRSGREMARIPRPLHEAPARGGPPHRPRPAHAGKPPGGGGEHRDRVHLRPRRVRRLARAARQGRERLRGGHPRAADRQGPARACSPPNPKSPRTQLTSSVDVAPLLLTIATGSTTGARDPHYSHIAGRLDLARHPRRPHGARTPATCCTPPTRP